MARLKDTIVNGTLHAENIYESGVSLNQKYLNNLTVIAGEHINEPGTPTVTLDGKDTLVFNYLKGANGQDGNPGVVPGVEPDPKTQGNVVTELSINPTNNKLQYSLGLTAATTDDLKNYIPILEKGKINGIATLNEEGKIPASQIPGSLNEYEEYDSFEAFPADGISDRIYLAKDTNKSYRWTGSGYHVIGSDLALGETSETAYAGNKGKQNATDIATLKKDKADKTELSNYIPKASESLFVKNNSNQEIKGDLKVKTLEITNNEIFNKKYAKRYLGRGSILLKDGTNSTYSKLPEADKTKHRVWKLKFPTGCNYWGTIQITIYGGYSSFNASGSISKRIICNFNGASIYSNVGSYNNLADCCEKDFRISEVIWNDTEKLWEFWIYSNSLAGNNTPGILLESWQGSDANYNSFMAITLQPYCELIEETAYKQVRAFGGGTKTRNFADLPIFQTPYGHSVVALREDDRLQNAHSILPNANATYNLGSSNYTWNTIYVKDAKNNIQIGNNFGLDTGITASINIGLNNKLIGNADSNIVIGNSSKAGTTSNGKCVAIGHNCTSREQGGVAIGDSCQTNRGVAIGRNSASTNGGAIGYLAKTEKGAAVGSDAVSGFGVSLGYVAHVANKPEGGNDNNGNPLKIDTVQLGHGFNTKEKSLQVYNYNIVDKNGALYTYEGTSTNAENIENKWDDTSMQAASTEANKRRKLVASQSWVLEKNYISHVPTTINNINTDLNSFNKIGIYSVSCPNEPRLVGCTSFYTLEVDIQEKSTLKMQKLYNSHIAKYRVETSSGVWSKWQPVIYK